MPSRRLWVAARPTLEQPIHVPTPTRTRRDASGGIQTKWKHVRRPYHNTLAGILTVHSHTRISGPEIGWPLFLYAVACTPDGQDTQGTLQEPHLLLL